jgi:hypothetical protein
MSDRLTTVMEVLTSLVCLFVVFSVGVAIWTGRATWFAPAVLGVALVGARWSRINGPMLLVLPHRRPNETEEESKRNAA